MLHAHSQVTWFEWQYLMEVLPGLRVLLLDDSSIAKSREVLARMKENVAWLLVEDNTEERHGFAVFERSESLPAAGAAAT